MPEVRDQGIPHRQVEPLILAQGPHQAALVIMVSKNRLSAGRGLFALLETGLGVWREPEREPFWDSLSGFVALD